MKILLIGRFYEEGFATFIGAELELLGHHVVRYDPGPPLLAFGSRARFYMNRVATIGFQTAKSVQRSFGFGGEFAALRKVIEKAGAIDLTLVCHDFLTPRDAAGVKQLTKAPLALWYPDPIWSFQKHMFLNGPYDFLFFKDPFIVDLLRRKIAAPVHYLPECFSPHSLNASNDHAPLDDRYAADICTAGNLYAYRVAFFSNLADKHVKIWGLPPPLWMAIDNVAPMNNLNPAEIWGTNVRTFEICGAGGFQIVDWRPGLAQLFDPGKELVTFDDVADLRRKIDHYLSAPEERAEIAAAGHRRALRDHTYAHRLQLLLDTIEGRRRGFPEPKIAWMDANA
jgi:spore maturation protein CgeB